MTKAHELDRSKQTAAAAPHNDDAVAPGRIARSAALVGPNGPMPSGLIQRKARDANGVEEGAGDAVARASSSSGTALPEMLMRKFEASLGADLSGVRLHTGSESAEAASAVGAKAYTLGQDIHFGAGHFDPSSSTGEHLLAHEVAHTVQQRGDVARMQLKPSVSSPGDAHEVEADRAADAMIAGAPFQVSSAASLVARDVSAVGKESVSVSTNSAKLSVEGGVKVSKDFGRVSIDGMLGLALEGEISWMDAPVSGGTTVGGAGDTKKGGNMEGGGKFEVSAWKDKAAKYAFDHSEKEFWDGMKPTEVKLVVDLPKVKEGKDSSNEGSVAVGVQVKTARGASLLLKGGYNVKTGELGDVGGVGGQLSAEMPLKPLNDEKLGTWAMGDVKLKGKVNGKFEGNLKPNWKALAKEAAEEVAKKEAEKAAAKKALQQAGKQLAQRAGGEGAKDAATAGAADGAGAAATDTVPTSWAAMGAAEVAPIAAGLLIIGAVVWAWAKSVAELADINSAKTKGKALVNEIVNGAMAGLTLGGGVAGAAGSQAFTTMNARLMKAYGDLCAKHKGAASEAEIWNALIDGLHHADAHAKLHAQVAPQIARAYAQDYYNRHASGFWAQHDAVVLDSKTIYADIAGGGFDSFRPDEDAARAAQDESDKREAAADAADTERRMKSLDQHGPKM